MELIRFANESKVGTNALDQNEKSLQLNMLLSPLFQTRYTTTRIQDETGLSPGTIEKARNLKFYHSGHKKGQIRNSLFRKNLQTHPVLKYKNWKHQIFTKIWGEHFNWWRYGKLNLKRENEPQIKRRLGKLDKLADDLKRELLDTDLVKETVSHIWLHWNHHTHRFYSFCRFLHRTLWRLQYVREAFLNKTVKLATGNVRTVVRSLTGNLSKTCEALGERLGDKSLGSSTTLRAVPSHSTITFQIWIFRQWRL